MLLDDPRPVSTTPPGRARRRASSWRRPLVVLRDAPATLPTLAAVALLLVVTSQEGGFRPTTWSPAALALLGLLAVSAWALRARLREMPITVRVALGALAAFTAWSYATIAWAGDRAIAWEGANRTLLYLVVFALFAAWRKRPVGAAVVLGAWTLGVIALAAVTVVHLTEAGALRTLFLAGRLDAPAGYPNAAAAIWMLAVWPALALAATRRVPWLLRGTFAGGAVLLADLALLTLSRGLLLATPIVLALWFALLPDRVRRLAVLVPVAGGIALGVPALLRLGDLISPDRAAPLPGTVDPALAGAARVALLGALAVAVVVGVGAALDERRLLDHEGERRVHHALGALGLAGVLALVVGGLVVVGHPVQRVERAWSSFKGGYGESRGSRLASGLGSERYDFYRVGLHVFARHPVAGIGADNFAHDYLVQGHSQETPRYPHSVELRTLLQTGLVGGALLVIALGAAAVAAWRGLRARDPLRRAVGVGALGAVAYWLVHGSADWFWEFAGLGAPAFALLGLACSLAPRRAAQAAPEAANTGLHPVAGREPASSGARRPGVPALALVRSAGRPLALAVVVGALLAGALAITAPWLATQEAQRATAVWRQRPGEAYDRLHRAAHLNPLSDQPAILEGSIALRLGDLAHGDRAFAAALARDPGDAYAALERGAIASTRGQRDQAALLLARAAALQPRDPIARTAAARARGGRRVDVRALNQKILRAAR